MFSRRQLVAVLIVAIVAPALQTSAADLYSVGVARIDITPEYPIRLTGYAVRKTESEGIEQRLWAKALAIGNDSSAPAVLITVDNCGVCANVTDEVAARLKTKAGIPRERLSVCSSHTHAGPCTIGFAPNIFAMPIPADQQATIARYTRELTDKLEQVALSALKDRKPARLVWNEGSVEFAKNRRTASGPADPSLPVLAAIAPDGKLLAVLANYACHCTTIGGEFNKTCGDWAGYAQEEIEANHAGAVALISIGCGADSNPHPRGGPDVGLALAKQHGKALAVEVKRMLSGTMTPLQGNLECRAKTIELPFNSLPTREELLNRAKQDGIVGYHAKRYLERLDRGETLPTTLPYFIQAWNFGDQLCMVFLAGEVVVDYSLRFKKEFDRDRLWVTAYANDVPCYIPSRRILQEGGYEAESSLWYYDRPARLSPAIEEMIHSTVAGLVPAQFQFDRRKAEFPLPNSVNDALAAFRVKAGLKVELVASEPLIVDPVAIDWSADGRLWVVEMRDYPAGMDGNWKPGGRVKVLSDTDGDGKYDRAAVFLDDLPFPTGVTAWNKGVLVCAAPEILYAEDAIGDGRADRIETLFAGFATNNYQARVNSLTLGLDNWIYGANGLIGGKIRRGADPSDGIDISGRDFRFRPGTFEFEPESGLTQQGRVRNDFGDWFGCDNSTLLWHYPLPERYARRNPHVALNDSRVLVPGDEDPNALFPISRTLERFNDLHTANRTTSACGLGLYRDELLGDEFRDNAFVCEPVHNLVHRLVLTPDGVTFKARRAPDEQQNEFLSSRDNWFRPVQVRTGPDGALYVVDMYRFVVEHPRWIAPERLAVLDVRAGENRGRIYRIVPDDRQPEPIRDLTKLATPELVSSLDSPNGTERDRIHMELLRRNDERAMAPLLALAKKSVRPAVRVQTLSVLDGLQRLNSDAVTAALADDDLSVRANALRLSEQFLPQISPAVSRLAGDTDAKVRFQFTLTLGEWNDPRAGELIGEAAVASLKDPWMRAAVLSSASKFPVPVLASILQGSPDSPERTMLIRGLVSTAVQSRPVDGIDDLLGMVAPGDSEVLEVWRLKALTSLIDELSRKGISLEALSRSAKPPVKDAIERIEKSFTTAYSVVKSAPAGEAQREAAIEFISRSSHTEESLPWLASWLTPGTPLSLQTAAVAAMARTARSEVPVHLLKSWAQLSPAIRNHIIATLLSRDDWSERLVSAVENGTVATRELSLTDRQRLLKTGDTQLRERSERLFSSASGASPTEAIARYAAVQSLNGDPENGAAIFEKNCASCHALAGKGHAVGPDLAAYRAKPAGDFVLAILNPSAAIEPRFINYQVETRDGRSLSGIVRSETANSLIVWQNGGIEETILRRDIASMRASTVSLMPEGLEQNIGPQEVADLLAWMKRPPAQ